MNLPKAVNVGIPLVGGILLVVFPQIFFKTTPLMTEGQIAKKKDQMRKIGYLMLGVAAIYFVVSLSSP